MESLFDKLYMKAKNMTDDEIKQEYSWINPSHLDRLLREIRALQKGIEG